MHEIKAVEQFVLEMDSDLKVRKSRALKVGRWCYFCGIDLKSGTCSCSMPESLRCHGQRVCPECAAAHNTIAEHLRRMFDARIVDRVSSKRAKFFDQLHSAAATVEEAAGKPLDNSLQLFVADACPFDDSKAEFEGKILAAFRRAKFADFQGLAAALCAEFKDEAALQLTRFFSSCAVSPLGNFYK